MDKLNCTFFLNLIAIKAEIMSCNKYLFQSVIWLPLEYECAYHYELASFNYVNTPNMSVLNSFLSFHSG